MKIFREIFARIWAGWGLIAFFVTMLFFLIPFLAFSYFRKEPLKTRRFILLARGWMNVFLGLVGCPLQVRGRENFINKETYIVVCNHNAFMDVPVSYPFIPGGNKTIAKIELSRIPLFGMIYSTGSVLVDRKSDASRKESYGKMKAVLDMGLHMCIYPEGTRNVTDEPLKPLHDGAFRLSIDTGKKIIPALIFNTRKAMPADKTFCLYPQKLYMHFLEPVAPLPSDNLQSLKQRVFEIMKSYYLEHRNHSV